MRSVGGGQTQRFFFPLRGLFVNILNRRPFDWNELPEQLTGPNLPFQKGIIVSLRLGVIATLLGMMSVTL